MAALDNNGGRNEPFGESDVALGESDVALWQLLGRARRVEASPYFARRVMREIAAAPEPEAFGWRWFLRVAAPAGVCAGLAILAIAGIRGSDSRLPAVNADVEFETIQDLDMLVSNYESSLWLDPSSPQR